MEQPKKIQTLANGYEEISRSVKKGKKSADSTHTHLTTTLPEHLIVEHILPRLPVKSLLCYKSVCKFWLSSISNPEFAKTHLKFSSLCPKFIVLSENNDDDDHSVDEHYNIFLVRFDECNNVKELVRLEFDERWVYTNLDVVGSCNGLVCLYLEEETKCCSFFMWNPMIRQYREIMNPEDQAFALDYGFGYASCVDDYKIFALFSPKKNGFGDFYVFSSRSGEWKKFDGLDGFYAATAFDDKTVVVNDTLYWPLKNLKDWQMAKCIVGFDVVNENLKEIPWMSWFGEYNRADFFGMKGCLSLHCHGDQGSDVWILKQYGDWDSWEKLFSVNLGGMTFLNFTETGKCLVKNLEQLKVVDPSKDASEQSQLGVQFPGGVTASGAYVESFISPFGTY